MYAKNKITIQTSHLKKYALSSIYCLTIGLVSTHGFAASDTPSNTGLFNNLAKLNVFKKDKAVDPTSSDQSNSVQFDPNTGGYITPEELKTISILNSDTNSAASNKTPSKATNQKTPDGNTAKKDIIAPSTPTVGSANVSALKVNPTLKTDVSIKSDAAINSNDSGVQTSGTQTKALGVTNSDTPPKDITNPDTAVIPPNTTEPPVDPNALPVPEPEIVVAPINNPTTWTLEQLNNAEWSGDLEKLPYPILARMQVYLSRQHTSPGAIDGHFGRNMLKSISAFQFINGQKVEGKPTEEFWTTLKTKSNFPAFQMYTITKADVSQKYASTIPADYALQAKMPCLCYTSIDEMLGEKFHIDQKFLKQINSKSSFKEGDQIIVPNIEYTDYSPVKMLIAHRKAGQLYIFNAKNKMIGTLPITVGSPETPSPTGNHKIVAVSPNPQYHYDPKNFIQGNNMSKLTLPSGPNNPVGVVWIGLSKPSYGLHGTPNPSSIDKTRSHGCVRLANWDATYLSKRVKSGVLVKFID